jgi:multidrug efflux system outer membrane protein
MRPLLTSMIMSASLLGAGCSPHKVTRNPAPPIAVPAAYSSIQADGSNLSDRWWQDFGDPELNKLVDAALQGNLQVRAAWERVKQARAVSKQLGAGKFPAVNLTGSVSKKSETKGPGGVSFDFPTSPVSIEASYEVDIFKKVSNSQAAAMTDAMAAQDQVEGLAMTLVAQIAETWFALSAQRASLELLAEQIKTSGQFLELAEMRLGQGLGSGLDLLQQRQQLAAVEGQRPLLESSVGVLENQLAILTGRAPSEFQAAVQSTLPQLPARPSSGVPGDLLLRRPDVRAARLQVEAADYRVAVAVANRLPSLRLGASYGPFQVQDLVFSTANIWQIGANLLAPLFQGGRLKAEVSRTEAVVQEKSYNYGQALLQALVEVENAAIQETKQVEYVAELQGQLVIAQETLEEARQRYSAGMGNESFIQILAALSSLQQIEQSLLRAQKQALSHRIQFCRALGGSWTQDLGPQTKGISTGERANERPQPDNAVAQSSKASTEGSDHE